MLEAARGYLRTRGFEAYDESDMYCIQPRIKGHRQRMREWLHLIDSDFTEVPFDDIPREFQWDKKYKVDVFSFNAKNFVWLNRQSTSSLHNSIEKGFLKFDERTFMILK